MKILVCISHVPDTTSKINFSENNSKFDKSGLQFVINPNDEFGLTRAVWFKEKNNATIDVINVGLQDTESTLRKALAIGADKAIRINHDPKDGFSHFSQSEDGAPIVHDRAGNSGELHAADYHIEVVN